MADGFPRDDYGSISDAFTESENWGSVASAPNQASEDYGSTEGLILPDANNIVTGNPTLETTLLSHIHNLTPSSFTSDTSEVNQGTLTQEHSLVPSSVLTEALSVGSAELDQEHALTALDILSGSPVVSSVAMIEDETFAPPSFASGRPIVGSSTLTQEHDLSANSLLTGILDVDRASFPVDEEEILAQETQEIEQMIGGWGRRAYEVPDGRLVQGEREIQRTYGDKVSIDRKAKSLIKFGRSAQLGTDGLETVWTCGDDEVYVTDNTISYVSSSSASDTQDVTIEGHTVSNGEFTFVIQTVTLNGQSAVALDTDIARVSRMYNSDNTELVGRVVVYENATLSGGVPTDATKIHIDIPAGFQQSFKAATTFSDSDYFICTGFYGSVSAKQSGSVDFYPEVRQTGKVFRQAGCFTASTNGGPADITLDPPLIVPKNADIRIRCETETNNLVVFGIFKGYIAKVL